MKDFMKLISYLYTERTRFIYVVGLNVNHKITCAGGKTFSKIQLAIISSRN